MDLCDADRSPRAFGPRKEKGAQASHAAGDTATFRLGDWVCTVLPETKDGTDYAKESLQSPWGQQRGAERVGELTIDGLRYTVIGFSERRAEPSDAPKLPEQVSVFDQLTRRELQVAMLVAQGRVNKQIASQLRVSTWTVSSHLRRIYTKLGVRTRAAMVARILQDVD